VICLEGDGSAMYTVQALWTQAREGLNVVNLILANRSYRILNVELQRVGAESAGARARRLLEIGRPDLDFVALSSAMGVPAARVSDAEALTRELMRALHEPGPHTIEVALAHA
jgi:acetolactate synthase-1/2/3 large subunit